jgi:hypothetical protein
LYFTGHQTPGSLTTLPNKVFTINGFNQNAKVGIKIPWGLQPTADFHTVGTVRHENLLTAQASPLVIDNLGNVYRSEGRQTGLDHIPKSEKIKLYQNAPNPFSQITRLRYFIPSTIQTGVIKIYNLSGKELKSYSVHFNQDYINIDAKQLSAGMYLAILIGKDGSTSQTIKMVLTK